MTQTILCGALETELAGAAADHDRLWIPLEDLERSTGWTAKPEGLCQGDTCVPLPPGRRADWLDGGAGKLDFAAFAAHLGHAVARDEGRALWAFGPPATAATDHRAASTSGPVAAPEFRLPDLDGKLHALSDYRGRKVLLYAWASW